jgi:hypothetical protein
MPLFLLLPHIATFLTSRPLSAPLAAARGRGRAKPGRCRQRRGLLVPSRARDNAGCLLHGVGMVRPPGTMARLLFGVAVGKHGGGREGRGEGRWRRRGLPFTAASLHLLGSIHGTDLGLP